MMKKTLMLFTLFMVLFQLDARGQREREKAKGYSGLMYFIPLYGHIHEFPERDSKSLTTIVCGHPLEVSLKNNKEGWTKVRFATGEGHVRRVHLSEKRPPCLIYDYPKFFYELNLDVSDMYYWGKLYDQYDREKTQVP